MNIAVLLRGFHYLARDRFGFPMDGRQYVESLERCILAPLRKEHHVKVFVATYPSHICDEMMEALRPDGTIILDSKTSNQVATFESGIELVSGQCPEFDKLVCTRFDLSYLQSIVNWNVWREDKGIYLPWREYESLWKQDHRVGDAIHVIDKGFVDLFVESLHEHCREPHLHCIFDDLAKKTDRLFFIEEGYFDSNTLYGNAECRNPLYRIGNRPRLPVREPGAEPAHLPRIAKLLQRRWALLRTVVAAEVSQFRHEVRGTKQTRESPGAFLRLLKSVCVACGAGIRVMRGETLSRTRSSKTQ
jgi:hypothetical protein